MTAPIPADRSADWLYHDGRDMPVDGDTLVCVRLRGGAEISVPDRAASWMPERPDPHNFWRHNGTGSDIIAYRVVQS